MPEIKPELNPDQERLLRKAEAMRQNFEEYNAPKFTSKSIDSDDQIKCMQKEYILKLKRLVIITGLFAFIIVLVLVLTGCTPDLIDQNKELEKDNIQLKQIIKAQNER